VQNIRFMFASAVDARCDYQCPAVQNAIDTIAKEFRDGRAGLLDALRRGNTTDDDFCDWVLVMWGRAPLTLATGRSRDEWLSLINRRN
jgi:hypothetical protein